MRWAISFTPVPRPLEQGADGEGSWLVSEAIAARTAVSDHGKSSPARAVPSLGEGLRAMHDALPVLDCPFSWAAEDRLSDARCGSAAGQIDRSQWHSELRHLSVERALALLADIPPIDRAVVCHGDACAPNTLLTKEGRWVAHVDLGRLGVADRWADLAVATWSALWNYGPGWDAVVLDAYGIGSDPDRTRYYRLLWDLGG